MTIGQVRELWRYPVKSLGGERLDHAGVTPRGILGDRLWAVRDVERDVTLSARQAPALLGATARYCAAVPASAGAGEAPEVEITFPGGLTVSSSDDRVHAELSDLVGREIRLTALPPAHDTSLHRLGRAERDNMTISALRADFGIAAREKLPDLSMMRIADLMTLARYSTPPGMFVDLAPVHVMTATSLATISTELGAPVDVRRFRPNIVLTLQDSSDELPEAQWSGGHLTMGGAVLDVTMPTIRCVVPSRAQPGIGVDRAVTRAVAAKAGRCLGSYCWVHTPGQVGVGDPVDLRMPTTRHRVVAGAVRRAKRLTFGAATSALDRFTK